MAKASKPKRFRVVPQEEGQPLRNVVRRRVADLDRERAAELIRAGGVYVNRLRVRLPHVLVAAGERITVYVEALDAEPLDPDALVFVHRDPSFVVLDKPAGVPVSAIREAAVGSLSEALVHRLEREGTKRPYVGVVHRLDRGASGLVLFTVRGVANKSLHKQFRDHRIRRSYRILVRPHDPAQVPASIRCEAPLIKLREGGVEIGQAGDGRSKPAVSQFRRLGTRAGDHVYAVEIETGRTHQIRAHAAELGLPIVGDRRYGGAAVASETTTDAHGAHDRLHLHAHALRFDHPLSGEAIALESTLPEWARVDEAVPDSIW